MTPRQTLLIIDSAIAVMKKAIYPTYFGGNAAYRRLYPHITDSEDFKKTPLALLARVTEKENLFNLQIDYYIEYLLLTIIVYLSAVFSEIFGRFFPHLFRIFGRNFRIFGTFFHRGWPFCHNCHFCHTKRNLFPKLSLPLGEGGPPCGGWGNR